MSRRRVACPQITQQLWDAIKIIRSQRQVPNVTRITRYMSRVHGAKEDEVRRQLNHCVRDGLVRLIRRMGYKGSKIGVEQEGYRLPQGMVEKDGHDWYCFECHAGGDVICCTSCHRVYHVSCLAKEELLQEDVKNTFVCPVCKMRLSEKDEKFKLKRHQLNRLLGFTCTRLKERLPPTITDRQVPSKSSYISDRSGAMSQLHRRSGTVSSDQSRGFQWVTDDGDSWRVNYLIYRPMDLRTMETKVSNNKYRSLQEFRADAETIVHNVVIYHGVHSTLADMARQMLRDCIYDLQEIRQCRDCYRVSNEKSDKHWFCQPCRPPHQLVYAKQKGFPYWPAKVIKVEGDQYDVRFFGGHHQRALIEKAHIRPISVNIHTLQVKRTSSWNKACEELKRHQDLLEKLRTGTGTIPNMHYSSEEEDEEEESEQNMFWRPTFLHYQPDVRLMVRLIMEESRPLKHVPGNLNESEAEERKPKIIKEEETEEEDDDDEEEDAEEDGKATTEGPESEEEDSISSSSKPVFEIKKEGLSQEDMVSSSCQEPRTRSVTVQTSARLFKNTSDKKAEKAQKDVLEKLRKEMEAEKQRMLKEQEERLRLELQQLAEKHKQAISEIKKKQWCYNCECEAIYHCCWNTAYCSIECQQLHWQKEHKRVCRRKR